jgi:hypothetical protein
MRAPFRSPSAFARRERGFPVSGVVRARLPNAISAYDPHETDASIRREQGNWLVGSWISATGRLRKFLAKMTSPAIEGEAALPRHRRGRANTGPSQEGQVSLQSHQNAPAASLTGRDPWWLPNLRCLLENICNLNEMPFTPGATQNVHADRDPNRGSI